MDPFARRRKQPSPEDKQKFREYIARGKYLPRAGLDPFANMVDAAERHQMFKVDTLAHYDLRLHPKAGRLFELAWAFGVYTRKPDAKPEDVLWNVVSYLGDIATLLD